MMGQSSSELDRRLAKTIAAHPRAVLVGKAVVWLLLTIVSPTLRIAACAKPIESGLRSIVIVCFNLAYLVIAITTIVCLVIFFRDSLEPLRTHAWMGWWIWAYYLWSRCAEVLIAFYRDALDQLSRRSAGSDLTASWRVWLALNSYAELIIDYALLYTLLPKSMWANPPAKITEAVWISVSTITTSGSANANPAHWLPQLLSTTEIIGGVILLVVCFALYAGGGAGERRSPVDADGASDGERATTESAIASVR
jgi:voltage-gated potassium channel